MRFDAQYLSPVLHGVLLVDFVVPLLKHPIHTLIHPLLVLLVVCNLVFLRPLTLEELKPQKKSNHLNLSGSNFSETI